MRRIKQGTDIHPDPSQQSLEIYQYSMPSSNPSNKLLGNNGFGSPKSQNQSMESQKPLMDDG